MKFTTEIYAISATTGNIETFTGQNIEADSWEAAEKYCQDNGLGWLHITGKLDKEIPATPSKYGMFFKSSKN